MENPALDNLCNISLRLYDTIKSHIKNSRTYFIMFSCYFVLKLRLFLFIHSMYLLFEYFIIEPGSVTNFNNCVQLGLPLLGIWISYQPVVLAKTVLSFLGVSNGALNSA